ncbi:MAG: hypothetical protein K0B37_16150, partial [Bacteroidales bacterium]|nr:hypothetical protein [Bacteroidales bacterium]
NKILWLIGNDERGLLYAAGSFLRNAQFASKRIVFGKHNEEASAPAYSIRGHQLGYRNTNNTCDSWTVAQYEKYIRELVIFGCNGIENIPFEDKAPSPVVKFTWEAMNDELSKICEKYALDYWVWTPATVDLSDPEKFEVEVQKHKTFYERCPHLSGVFVPGGDPGHNHPSYLIPFLKAISLELKKHHHEAGVWVSLQGFNHEQTDYFFDHITKNQPDWLTGVVSGPGSPDMAVTRFRLPKKYKHRHYPDITHTVRCQYPTPQWDQAFALTLGREPCNPQPVFYAEIHRQTEPFTDGSVTYSDGVHDDVNKVLWSCLDWNPERDIHQILEEYSRFFFGTTEADHISDAILALERNWQGAIEDNGSIETTFSYWQNLEQKYPELDNNWRWVQLVMRSYYDNYTRKRKLYENSLEKEAMQILEIEGKAEDLMNRALEMVYKAETEPRNGEIKKNIEEYCEKLYQQIGLQTSVKKYNASGPERGCVLDFIDYPLNNRWWLEDEFNKIRQMQTEQEKQARLEIIRTWDNPGEGSFYDNVSDVSQSPHVQTQTRKSYGYAWWDQGMSRKRLSTQLNQNQPELIYEGLDPEATYTIRIAGEGEALLRVDGERVEPLVYPKNLETFKEFHITQKYVSDSKITVSFDVPEESHLNWRHKSKICDIWLIKN